MALGWKRVPILLILLIFWENAIGYKGWHSHAVPSNQNWPVLKIFSPRGAQSSVLEAPVTGSNPLEEVASNELAWQQPNASSSLFSLPLKYVKGGLYSSYVSMSPTQSAPNSSVSASLVPPLNQQNLDTNSSSLLQLEGSFSSSIQDVANQPGLQLGETSTPLPAQSNSFTGSSASSLSEVTYTAQDSSGSQMANGSSQLGASGLLPQSPSTASQKSPGSPTYAKRGSSLFVSRQATRDQGSYNVSPSSSSRGVGAQLAGSSRYVSMQTGNNFTGSSLQLQGTASKYEPAALVAKFPAYNQAVPSGSSSLNQTSQWQPSISRWSQGFQTSGTVASQGSSKSPSRFSASSPGHFSSPQAGSGRYSGLFSQSQSASSQYNHGSPAYTKRVSSLLDLSNQATRDQGSYMHVSNSTLETGAPLAVSTFTDGSSLQLQGTTSKYESAALVAKVPVYNQTAPSGSSSPNRTSQWQPSISRWSQGFQTSGTVASQGFQTSGTLTSQGSSESQGSKSPSSFSTLISAASPGQFSFKVQGTTSKYEPAALVAKLPASNQAAPSGSASLNRLSQWQPSISRWSQGIQTSGTTTSQSSSPSEGSKSASSFSTHTSAAIPVQSSSTQAGSGRYSGLFSQSQSASSQYNPGSPAYTKRLSSLLDLSSQATRGQGSYVYTSSSTPGTGAQLAGSTFTDGSSLQLQGTTTKYESAALVAKLPASNRAAPSGSSPLNLTSQWQPSISRWSQGIQTSGTLASQGFQTSGTLASQGSSQSQGSKSPSSFSTLTPVASPGQFSSTRTGSGRDSGLFSQSQSASSQYSPKSPAYVTHGSSLLVSPPATRDQGSYNVYTSNSSQGPGAQLAGSSRNVLMQTGSTFSNGSSLQLQGTTSKYEPVAKLPASNQAAPSGSASLNRLSQRQPSIARWSQGIQTLGTTTSKSSSPSEGSKSPSSFSTLTSAAIPVQSSSTQAGSGRYSGLFSQSQSASSQYNPGSPAYTKRVSSLLDLSSQATRDQGYVSMSSSTLGTGAPLAGSTFTDGSSLQLQGATSKYEPVALVAKFPASNRAAPSGSSPLNRTSQWQPSISRSSQGFQATGTAVSQSSSSPKTSQLSAASFMPALGPPVTSVAQSSQPSTLSLHALHFGTVIRRQKSPGLPTSVRRPTDSVTSSLDSNVHAASQGIFSSQSSDPTVITKSYSSTYIQKPSGYSSPSQSTSASGRYFSSVKG
ncbi:streptococcal hemagglutinin isoform X1 [Pseudorasbora parva]|uniref:streptococcal hemagglutinin isoform X1 n=1 Tax=Pseudorasbora parva TaxID=51549 RepID=UPI00351EA16F